MQVGDLVRFRNCQERGKLGIIVRVPKFDVLYGNKNRVYYCLCEGNVLCYTGHQLEALSASR